MAAFDTGQDHCGFKGFATPAAVNNIQGLIIKKNS